jgi:hypothetical protein
MAGGTQGHTLSHVYVHVCVYACVCVQTGHPRTLHLTSISPLGHWPLPLRAPSLEMFSSMRESTIFFMSLCSLLPKSLNIVVPPDRTMLLYSPLLTSIGHLTIASSTTSGSGVMKSEEKISGLKKTSGPRNRSYPTSHLYGSPVLF